MRDKNCSKCSELKPVSEFGKHKGNKDGLTYYCKGCVNSRNLKFNKTIAGRWRYRKYDAGRKGREFSITQEQFEAIATTPEGCYLCGTTASQLSLDRVNNLRGYTIDNVAACCWPCNASKGASTLEEWKKKENK
jgi:hypothetical protein